MKRFLGILLLMVGIVFTTGRVEATETTFYEGDITPPWGRIYVEDASIKDGITYVGTSTINVRVYANDDMCADGEIKYYLSTTEISDATKLDDSLWRTYSEGDLTQLTLKEDNTQNIYAIFKDLNGNTSLIYEANSNTVQNIVYNANGGVGVPTGVDTQRVFGKPYIIPNQEPYKGGYAFLGWSTDPEATEASYKQGDDIPADASLGSAS